MGDMEIADELGAISKGKAKPIAQKLHQHTVKVQGGSGVIWHSDGLIITNAHVATSKKTTVKLWDGRVVEAVRVKIDPTQDLAALKVAATIPAATIGNSDDLRVGELVMAIGHPFGDRTAMTTGIVSQVTPSHILADIHLFPGNSGGLLANCYGRVVGINSMIAYGWGVAISTRLVENFLAKDYL